VVNSVEIRTTANAVTISLFDVYTTVYFLTESMLFEDHKRVGEDDEL